jgi:HPt (histidine-containing phosphotransfer) domain-containing protein
VIAMTANAMVGDREAVLEAGMNDHIAKPIVIDEMFATLARWVKPSGSQARQADALHADAVLAQNAIDTRCGLANCSGNGVLYRRVLGMFRERELDFAQRFRAARAAGDADAARRAAHDLKGGAGTLGMHGLQQAADALERACLGGEGDAGIDDLLHKASDQLDKVFDELRARDSTLAS